jgi:uncharacterized membrane protein YqhA
MSRVEAARESLVFRSRWLLAPFFIGLIIALLVKFLNTRDVRRVGRAVRDHGPHHRRQEQQPLTPTTGDHE